MKLINITFMSITCSLMVACGGGGGSSSSSSSSSVSVEPTPIKTVSEEPDTPVVEPEVMEEPVVQDITMPDPEAIYETTAELVAATSFLIKPEYDLTVTYGNKNNRNAYLSVCTEFSEENDTIKVNYDSCLLRTSISTDYEGKLSVANDKTRLVMAIWYLDDTKNPRYEIWQNNPVTNESQHFIVN